MHRLRLARLRRHVLTAVGACLLVAGCGDDAGQAVSRPSDPVEPHECDAAEGSELDVAHEPGWRPYAAYLPWTDRDGCLLRIDVVAERPGPEHCEWQAARTLIVGQPLGARYTTPADTTEFVRDPAGVYGRPELTAGFDPDATLPPEAVDKGYRRDDLALWHIPGDQTAIWLVSPDGVERWPAGETPLCS